jgi:transcriptional regulator with XRE-family HTH domain
LAKIKVRPHPGALSGLLSKKAMTQVDAAGVTGVDRKTLAKIDRGEEVKLETLQKLARKLNVPTTHFEPPAASSVDQADSQGDDSEWLDLMLRRIDADALMDLMFDFSDEDQADRFKWQLNVHTVDDEAIPLLEQFEDAVKDLNQYLKNNLRRNRNSLREQLDELKKIKRVTSLVEELAKHRLAILGVEYLYWEAQEITDPVTQCSSIDYVSRSIILLSIEGTPAHERREKVYQGTVPPKFAPDSQTLVYVDGNQLETEKRQGEGSEGVDDDPAHDAKVGGA